MSKGNRALLGLITTILGIVFGTIVLDVVWWHMMLFLFVYNFVTATISESRR